MEENQNNNQNQEEETVTMTKTDYAKAIQSAEDKLRTTYSSKIKDLILGKTYRKLLSHCHTFRDKSCGILTHYPRKQFPTIRCKGGLSGFPNRQESKVLS